MRLWLVRLGKNGEGEKSAQDESLLSIDFGIREDITGQGDRDAILSTLTKIHPDAKPNTLKNYAAQINQFVNMAETGDLVISPMKTTSTAIPGRVAQSSERVAVPGLGWEPRIADTSMLSESW